MFDQHFTPRWLADQFASTLPKISQGFVVDLAAGEGALLEAVERLSGSDHTLAAIDIDPRMTSRLRSEHPDWLVSTANSLLPQSRSSSTVWQSLRHAGADLVVLNPPFSFRGGAGVFSSFGDFRGRLSPALRFVATALGDVRPRLGIQAILPDGALMGEKNSEFWKEVRKRYEVTILEELSSSSFRGVRARCSIVRAVPLVALELEREEEFEKVGLSVDTDFRSGCTEIEVIRGRVPVHALPPTSGDLIPFLHTTSIRGNRVGVSKKYAHSKLATPGPLVLLPRVGYPGGKIATHGGSGPVVLSDCLFGLRPVDGDVRRVAELIRSRIDELSAVYSGTGAPYLTLTGLLAFLSSLGLVPLHAKASANARQCRCEVD